MLLWLAAARPHDTLLLLAVASAGNTLGGMTSWGIGRFVTWRFPLRTPPDEKKQRALEHIRRWGSPLLLLSWLPVVGDPLCLAAGLLKVTWWRALLFIAIGKAGRYAVLLLFA